MPKPTVKVPTRTVVIDDRPVTLRADFNAMYELEQLTGKNLFEIVGNSDENKAVYTTCAQLLYALSASHRDDAGQEQTFKQFLRTLPSVKMEEFHRLSGIAFGLIGQTLTGSEKGPDLGNGPTPAAELADPMESTGDGSTTQEPSPSVDPTTTSGE